jgi:hypothetical protein
MKKHLKILLFVASLSVAISASAQSEQTWSVSDSKLLPDGVAFEIVLIPNSGAENRAVTIRINPDDKTIAYNKLSASDKLPGLPVTIDLSNQTEKQSLVSLLEAYKKYAAGQDLAHLMGNDGSVHSMIADAGHRAAFKTAAEQYNGALGQCVEFSEFYDLRPDQPLCFTFRGRFDLLDLVLPEPAALLWTINHQDDFLQLRSAALKKKQEIELAAQQAELAKIKAVEDEREKAHQEELRKLGQKAEVAKQRAVGAEREQQRGQELLQAKKAKVIEYLGTSSGLRLAVKIEILSEKTDSLRAEENAERASLRKTVLDDATLNHKSWYEFNRGMEAVNGDSSELMEMEQRLGSLLRKFQNDCGSSYGEAWELGGEAIIKHEITKQKITHRIALLVCVLVAGIFIYRAAKIRSGKQSSPPAASNLP